MLLRSFGVAHPLPQSRKILACKPAPRPCGLRPCRAGRERNSREDLEDYVECRVDSVRVSAGASVVNLRCVGGLSPVVPVHIGETESTALLKEINKQRQSRPLTHDLVKHMLQAISFRITKVLVTEVVANTYHARIHLAHVNADGQCEEQETYVDARPSDAINLAVRFGAPIYINKKIADSVARSSNDAHSGGSTAAGASTSSATVDGTMGETHADIVRSVRETLSGYEDPTIMMQLQKELAVREERYQDAKTFQSAVYREMTHNQGLRLVVAMEAALADGRFEEAARLRDEYRAMSQAQQRVRSDR